MNLLDDVRFSLTWEDEGVWKINTATGSTYRLDLTNKTQTRTAWSHNMRRDDQTVTLCGLDPVHIGQPMVMLLHIVDDPNIVTLRQTSPVISIWRAD